MGSVVPLRNKRYQNKGTAGQLINYVMLRDGRKYWMLGEIHHFPGGASRRRESVPQWAALYL